MGIRSSPLRQVPGNPLAGVLRQTARKARSTSRRSSVPGPPGPPGPAGPAVAAPVIATVLTTGETGVASLTFEPLQANAVVAVTPVGVAAVVTVAEASATSVTLQAWLPDGVTSAPSQDLHVVIFGTFLVAPPDEPTDEPNYTGPEQPTLEGTT